MAKERMDRRGFWRALLREAVTPQPAEAHASTPPAHARPRRTVMRPPGAREEEDFLQRCAPGCRMCVDACPVFAIVPSYDDDQPGGGDGRPFLLPDRQACILCGLCMQVCPTGALAPTPPEDVRIGRALIRFADCIRLTGETCRICLDTCPAEPNCVTDDDPVPVIAAPHCTGCGLCAEACPPSAISVVPLPP